MARASRPAGPRPPRDPVFDDVEKKYLPIIMDEVEDLAKEKSGTSNYDYIDVVKAFEEYFDRSLPKKTSFGSSVSGFLREYVFILVCALMTIIFGGLGLTSEANAAALRDSNKPAAYQKSTGSGAQGYLDIAKIFAGAVVGGAAGKINTSPNTPGRRRNVPNSPSE